MINHSITLYYTAVVYPVSGVGSSRLALTAALQTSLSPGSASDRPRSRMSFLTHSFQVLRGRPRPLLPGTAYLLALLMPPDSSDLQTWPYHLNLLVPKAEVISSSPSLDRRSAVGVLSIIRTLQILRIIALSVRCSRCKSGTVGAHVSLPWSRAERT